MDLFTEKSTPKKAQPSTRRHWLLDFLRANPNLGTTSAWNQYTERYKGGYKQFLSDWEHAKSSRYEEIRTERASVDILEDNWIKYEAAIEEATAKGAHTAVARLLRERDQIFRPETDPDALSQEGLRRIWDRAPMPKDDQL